MMVTGRAMQDVFVRGNLVEPVRLRALSTPSDARGLLQLGGHAGAILATGAGLWATLGTLWAVPVFMLHGVLINFLYAGQHELSHSTVFRTRWLNEAAGRAIGFLMLFPRDFDQVQHFAHHRHTQDWARDGELARPRYTLASYLLNLLGPAYWYYRVRRILRFSAGIVTEPYIPAGRRAGMVREARWHLAGYGALAGASVAAGSWAVALYWLAPMLAMKVAHQLQNTIEHVGLPHSANILENTRSTRAGAVLRWMCWNMQYHTAHHAFPGVPFHQLPALERELFTRHGSAPPRMGYLEFQFAAIRAFARRGEAEWPDDKPWIPPPPSPPLSPHG